MVYIFIRRAQHVQIGGISRGGSFSVELSLFFESVLNRSFGVYAGVGFENSLKDKTRCSHQFLIQSPQKEVAIGRKGFVTLRDQIVLLLQIKKSGAVRVFLFEISHTGNMVCAVRRLPQEWGHERPRFNRKGTKTLGCQCVAQRANKPGDLGGAVVFSHHDKLRAIQQLFERLRTDTGEGLFLNGKGIAVLQQLVDKRTLLSKNRALLQEQRLQK